jgi:valyl-tRNA synthetase
LQALVSEVRHIKTVLNETKGKLYHDGKALLIKHSDLIEKLAGLEGVQAGDASSGVRLIHTPYGAWLDIDRQAIARYKAQLHTQKVTQTKLITQLKARLANQAYVKQAPEKVVEQTRQQLADAQLSLEQLSAEQARF